MNRRHKPPPPRSQAPAYREAFDRLDAALEANTPSGNHEKIRLMRLALFADVNALKRTGSLVIPK
jgi:hypothetical protein